jgi:hypothetical protein
MTIRLRCAECKRKLKVPDEALGKKVQCPQCGARFIGTIELPPAEPQPSIPKENGAPAPLAEAEGERVAVPAATPVERPLAEIGPAPEAAPDETPLIDTLFTEIAEHRLPDVTLPPESPPSSAPPSPFLNLELEESPAQAEPAEEQLEDMVILDDTNVPEPVMLGDASVEPLAALEEEPVEVVEEVDDEEVKTPEVGRKPQRSEPVEEEEAEEIEELEEVEEVPVSRRRQTPKKSRKGLLIGLLLGGLALLAGCAGVGYAVYRYFGETTVTPTFPVRTTMSQRAMVPPPPALNPGPAAPANPPPAARRPEIPDNEWKWISPPGSRCSFQMPGNPRRSTIPEDGAIHFQVERPRQECLFEVAYHDLDAGKPPPPNFLEQSVEEIRKRLLGSARGGSWKEESIKVGVYPGRELVFAGQQAGTTLTRLYLVQSGKMHRVYQLTVSGASIYRGQGDARKFFQSFMIASGDR